MQPDWGETRPIQWVDDLVGAVRWAAQPGERVILGGFSLGALVAALAAERLTTSRPAVPHVLGVMAVSLTSLYGEHVEEMCRQFPQEAKALTSVGPDGRTILHPSALDDLMDITLPNPDCLVQLYIGSKEPKPVQDVTAAAHAQWQGSELIVVPGGA